MTQVTDEMVEAAVLSIGGWVKAGESFNDHMRAALEAALAVRGERQAEEIAELRSMHPNERKEAKDRYRKLAHSTGVLEGKMREEICRLTADRAELIAALRPFARAVYNDNGDVTVSHASIGEYMRARALLERLGAKEKEG